MDRRTAFSHAFAGGTAGPRADASAPRATPDAVQRALSRLPDEHRAVLRLINVDRLTYREAAERLGIARDVLVKRLVDARRSFTAALADASAD